MSSLRIRREEPACVAVHREQKPAQRPPLPAASYGGRNTTKDNEQTIDVTDYQNRPGQLLGGKRKYLQITDEESDTSPLGRPTGSTPSSVTKNVLPSYPTKQLSRSLDRQWEGVSSSAVSCSQLPRVGSDANDSQGAKRQCQRDRHTLHVSPVCSRKSLVYPPEVTSINKVLPMRPYESTEQLERQATTTAIATRVDTSIFPACDIDFDHPLSDLIWPFDLAFEDTETERGGGGGGGSQPSTTGSHGFPQFVTAGLNVADLGRNLFGYDREELMGSISWA